MSTISGMIFDNQIPTAKGFRALFSAALLDGVVDGCALSYDSSAKTLTIGEGYYHCAGGEVYIPEGYTVTLSSVSKKYARIIATIDTSATADETTFSQFTLTEDSNLADFTKFPSLQTDDINSLAGGTYKSEFCILDLKNSPPDGITYDEEYVYRKNKAGPKVSYGTSLPAVAPAGSLFILLKTT